MHPLAEFADKFWSLVVKTEDCWLWCAGRFGPGYGSFYVPGSHRYLAHRAAWELTNGPIPPGVWVLHRCDNPSCVRPDHLWLGVHRDNMRDMVRKGRHWGGRNNGRWKEWQAAISRIRCRKTC